MTMQAFDIEPNFSVPLRESDAHRVDGFYHTHTKRALDLLLVLLAAPLVLPIVLLMALAVWLDGGKPFYTQERIGRNGKIFKILKIRSMVPNADALLEAHLAENPKARAEWDANQKLKNDPRITRLGRFLRKTSMDELPQLWNVANGSMSLIGPRPMMTCQRAQYPGQAYYWLRPGITGFWQISDRNDCSFACRAKFDDDYARHVSIGTDIRVLFQTLGVVMRATGH